MRRLVVRLPIDAKVQRHWAETAAMSMLVAAGSLSYQFTASKPTDIFHRSPHPLCMQREGASMQRLAIEHLAVGRDEFHPRHRQVPLYAVTTMNGNCHWEFGSGGKHLMICDARTLTLCGQVPTGLDAILEREHMTNLPLADPGSSLPASGRHKSHAILAKRHQPPPFPMARGAVSPATEAHC
jgi:hypothetical protein